MASISAVVGVDRGPGAIWLALSEVEGPMTTAPVSVSTKRAREILRIILGLRERSSITDAFFWSGSCRRSVRYEPNDAAAPGVRGGRRLRERPHAGLALGNSRASVRTPGNTRARRRAQQRRPRGRGLRQAALSGRQLVEPGHHERAGRSAVGCLHRLYRQDPRRAP